MKFVWHWYRHIGVIASAIALFFLTRLYNITSLPIFTDEAIYVRWSQIAKQDASWRFISLTDGKQPLFIWISAISMKFISDPLLAARCVSVGAGFVSLVGLFFLGYEVFRSKKVGFLASALYVLFPFALVYDKMALYDSLLGALAVWALYFEIHLIKRKRLDIALILGMVLGTGLLTKSSAFFFIYLLPLSFLLFDFKSHKKVGQAIKFVLLATVSIVLAYAMYGILRLSPFFHIVDEKNTIFVYPFSEWLSHPFTFFIGNVRGLFDWLLTYITYPIAGLCLLSFFLGKRIYLREKILLFSWFLVPFLALALFGRVIYPRFIFFMTLPLLVLAAYSLYVLLEKIKIQSGKIVLILLFVFIMIRTDYFILTDFSRAPIPFSDLSQYINEWPAGGGVAEAVEFFKEQSVTGKVTVFTQGTFGLMPYAFEIYLKDNPNIQVKGFWPVTDIMPKEFSVQAKSTKVYLVFYQPCVPCRANGEVPISWPVKKILSYKKGAGNAYLNIYEVIP